MAFVILSAGRMAQSKMRTVGVKTFLAVVAATMFIVLAIGIALGYGLGRDVIIVETKTEPAEPALQPDDKFLIDRFGELSGRVLQLEAEAAGLAERIGIIKEFESRIQAEAADPKQRPRVAKTAPGAPAGGPMLQPLPGAANGAAAGAPAGRSGADMPAPAEAHPLSDKLSLMEGEIGRVAEALARVDKAATSQNLANMSFPSRAPVADSEVSSGFGNRIDPFGGRLAFHSGIDFPAPKGTPIVASAGGRVIFAGYRSEYGYTVEIDHGAGLATRYAHASKLLVKTGQVVMPGQEIARIGSTGRSTGAHLHFEILKDGAFADPSRYLVAHS